MPGDNHLKTIDAMLISLILIALLCALSCKECPTEQPDYDIFLTAEDVFCTSVVLKVTLPDSGDVNTFALDRDDSTLATYTCNDDDTLIIDEGLTPSTDYTYRVRFLNDGKTKSESDLVSVHTQETTSHSISYWEIDTLGISGEIHDLWIISENDILAVGEIVVEDPDSSFNGTGEETFNAARWDGEKWNLMRIVAPALLYSIFYFSEKDIWVTTFGLPIHWDGNNWTLYHIQNMGIDASAGFGIWGISSSNIYFVGYKGSIVHYDGSKFRKIESGTTCTLEDVWGIDDNHIWAVGTEIDLSQSVILFYNGKTWKTIHDTQIERECWSNSVWTDSPYLLYLNGGSGRCVADLIRGNISRDMSAGEWFGYDIYGTAYNDVYASTAGSELLHFNGSTWYLYPEIKSQFQDYFRIMAVKATNEMVVGGGYYYTGLYGLPIVIRGYR